MRRYGGEKRRMMRVGEGVVGCERVAMEAVAVKVGM